MTLTMPDPNPGRCLNHRPSFNAWGQPTSVRCLMYEADKHVCVFPDPPQRVDQSISASSSYQQVSPTPWVSPVSESA